MIIGLSKVGPTVEMQFTEGAALVISTILSDVARNAVDKQYQDMLNLFSEQMKEAARKVK